MLERWVFSFFCTFSLLVSLLEVEIYFSCITVCCLYVSVLVMVDFLFAFLTFCLFIGLLLYPLQGQCICIGCLLNFVQSQ